MKLRTRARWYLRIWKMQLRWWLWNAAVKHLAPEHEVEDIPEAEALRFDALHGCKGNYTIAMKFTDDSGADTVNAGCLLMAGMWSAMHLRDQGFDARIAGAPYNVRIDWQLQFQQLDEDEYNGPLFNPDDVRRILLQMAEAQQAPNDAPPEEGGGELIAFPGHSA